MTKVLVCFVGIPAVGKSTLAHNLQKDESSKLCVICYDDMIGRVDMDKDPNGWNVARKKVLEHVVEVITSTKGDLVLLLDDTFHLRGMRKEVFHLAQRYGCVFGQIHFQGSVEVACKANMTRDNPLVTMETINRISVAMEPPSEQWEKHVLKLEPINSFCDSTTRSRSKCAREFLDYLLIQLVETDPGEREKEREADRVMCRENVKHRSELILRKLVKETIKKDRLNGVVRDYSVYGLCKSRTIAALESHLEGGGEGDLNAFLECTFLSNLN